MLAGAVSCGSGGGPSGPTDSFDRRGMLDNLANNLLVPTYEAFAGAAATLESGVQDYCASLGTAGEAAALATAQVSWRATMDAWQLAEAMLLGPAAMNERTLRERVYSWPTISSCAVDQEVEAYRLAPTSFDIGTRLNNRRGLDAIEYLLFAPSLDHTCSVQVAPVGWNELADDLRATARCGYGELAAADVAAQAVVITTAWSPAGGDFVGDLSGAGTEGSSFATAQEAVNVVSDALFYLDGEVKDMKLAEPAGITINTCDSVQAPCLEELESLFAQHSRQNVAQNLLGFSRLFHGDALDGTSGLGFDDFLIELGAPELAATMSTDIEEAMNEVDVLTESLREALVSNYEQVVVIHAATRDITNSLKSQFLTVLGLDLPDAAAGDND